MGEVAVDFERITAMNSPEAACCWAYPKEPDFETLAREDVQPGRRAVVIGLGKSGIAAARLLVSKGVEVIVSESRPLSSLNDDLLKEMQALGIRVEAGGNNEALFDNKDFVVLSPGVPLDIPCIEVVKRKGMPIIGEFGLAAMFLETPCVAITGTNGKSTVTSLIGEMLRAAGKDVFVGGNIGTPLAEYVIGRQESEAVVLEVSSFQLDTAGEFKPDVAVLLNISPDHLDRYASYDDYARSKWSIFQNQDIDNFAVINWDDAEIIKKMAIPQWEPGAKYFYFGSTRQDRPGVFGEGRQVVLTGFDMAGDEEYDLLSSGLSEEPNRHNAMAAILAARLLGCPAAGIQAGLGQFTSLPHRLALVDEINGVKYFDDSKATNVGAVVSALEAIDEPVVLIAGGKGKHGGYELLVDAVHRKVRACVLIGEAKQEMLEALKGATYPFVAASLAEAVDLAAELAAPGEAVLLSPACASFDMFAGYAERGEEFRRAVDNLSHRHKAKRGGI